MTNILKTMNNELDWHEYYFNKKILILGGLGFIGSNLAKEFVNFGAKVIIVDGFIQHTGANVYNIQNIIKKIELYKYKIEDLDCLPEIVEISDFIIDSMALTSHNFGVEHPIFDTQINLLSHLYLISALKKARDKKIIYLGSRGQYGSIKGDIITENTPQDPVDPQGINKVAAESFFKFYAKKYDFKVVSLRITNCFGENQNVFGNDIGLVGSLIRDILGGKTVEIYGSKKRLKNIIYIKDLIKIILQLIMTDFDNFEVFNIAGSEISLVSLLDKIIENIGRGNYVVKPFPIAIKHIDTGGVELSDTKIKKNLGELKFYDLNKSLTNTINYFKERLYAEGYNDIKM